MTITLAKVVKIVGKDSIKIEIPADFLESTMAKEDEKADGYAVIIFTPSTKIIKIYPAKSGVVARIEVGINELTPDFLQEVSSIFLEAGIKTLYSTGVCFTSESCLYEVYVDKQDYPESFDLKARLGEIRGVGEVKIDMLEPEN
ncbi:MAG: hypothetical protein HeimC3_26740 [Candidatus Heimdallarchaeota archaeon LC_3]|nr:MAG: hypothetical protein HeimC3_26740 [Candidatus Heimdallarchaeota archaeon LC_3]